MKTVVDVKTVTNKFGEVFEVPEGMKFCSKCNDGRGNVLLVKEFGKNKTTYDGLYYICKVCANATKQVLYNKRKVAYDEAHSIEVLKARGYEVKFSKIVNENT